MATVDRHPRSRFFRARFIGPDGQRLCRTLKTEDRSLAVKMAADLELAARRARAGLLTTERGRAVLNEILSAAGQTPLDTTSTRTFCAGWINDKTNTKASTTATLYGRIIRNFLLSLGPVADQPLSAVLPRHIEAFRDEMTKAGRAPSSMRLDVKIIGGVFRKAVRQGFLAVNPCGAVEMDEAAGQTREPFTAEEIDALLSAADAEWKTVIMLGAYGGLRLGDAVRMSWAAVDLAEGTLTFRPQKTARSGRVLVVPLHPRLAKHLETIAGDEGGPLSPVLAKRSSGGENGLSRRFLSLMERAGLRREDGEATNALPKTFHSLRHSFNSALLAAGVDEKTRMDLSGHSSAKMNRRYSHSELATLKAAVSKI